MKRLYHQHGPLPKGNHDPIGFSNDDKGALDKAVHFVALSETSAIDAIRQRRLLELRENLLSERVRTNSLGLIGYFDSSERRIFLTTNYDECLSAASARPPCSLAVSGILSLFLSSLQLESFVGDIEERYSRIFHTHGHRAATRWFYREVIHSFLSLTYEALKRVSGIERLLRRIGS
jgi:hypothetical protein